MIKLKDILFKENYEFILSDNPPQETFTIKNRLNNSIIYETEAESLKDAVEQAVREGVSLIGAYLKRADLRGANLRGAYLEGAYLEGANLEGADLKEANLREADLESANLEDAFLYRAYLEGANLYGADLGGANLYRAYLEGANLYGANLEAANLKRANLKRANLGEANLVGANLAGANLEGADLYGANLEGAIGLHLNESINMNKIKLPKLIEIFLQENYSNQDELYARLEKQFGIKAKDDAFAPNDQDGNLDKSGTYTEPLKIEMDIDPRQEFEDNDSDDYAMRKFSQKAHDLYSFIYLNMPERAQMEVSKKLGSYVSSDMKYKYNIKDFEKAWKSLSEEEKKEFGKYFNRQRNDSFLGLSTF